MVLRQGSKADIRTFAACLPSSQAQKSRALEDPLVQTGPSPEHGQRISDVLADCGTDANRKKDLQKHNFTQFPSRHQKQWPATSSSMTRTGGVCPKLLRLSMLVSYDEHNIFDLKLKCPGFLCMFVLVIVVTVAAARHTQLLLLYALVCVGAYVDVRVFAHASASVLYV